MTVLQDAVLTLKLKNYTDKVMYLGQDIRPGRTIIEEARMKFPVAPKEPRTQTEPYSFPGLVDVYQRFIPNVSDVSRPL